MLNKMLNATSLDGTTGASIYKDTQHVFSNGDFAKGFVCLKGGFSVPAGASASLDVLKPISGNINLNDTGKMILTGDLIFGPNVKIQKGGKIDARNSTIFLNYDLTIPANTGFTITSDTVIDGQGHEIIFGDGNDGGYIWIDGPVGTTLTIRNCIITGLKNYTAGYGSIGFGSNTNQKLILNEVVAHMAGDYTFVGGLLDFKNFVNLTGTTYNFIYNSEYPLTIKSDSTLFIDNRTFFTYQPILTGQAGAPNANAKLLIMEDKSSKLFLNGCTLYLPLQQGLILTNGNLIVDHKTNIYGNGAISTSYAYGLAFGNGNSENDLLIDIMPGATFEIQETTLHYNNSN